MKKKTQRWKARPTKAQVRKARLAMGRPPTLGEPRGIICRPCGQLFNTLELLNEHQEDKHRVRFVNVLAREPNEFIAASS